MTKRVKHPDQTDLFEVANLFPVRAPSTLPRALDFNRKLAAAMSEAIRVCGRTRESICAEMTAILGYEDASVTIAQLNAYTSTARETHTISLVRFLAFARATGCVWLWDVVLHDEGLTLMEGAEALHAQASLAEKRGRELLEQAEVLRRAAPSTVRVPRGRS